MSTKKLSSAIRKYFLLVNDQCGGQIIEKTYERKRSRDQQIKNKVYGNDKWQRAGNRKPVSNESDPQM